MNYFLQRLLVGKTLGWWMKVKLAWKVEQRRRVYIEWKEEIGGEN
jgi:hypothetical protein